MRFEVFAGDVEVAAAATDLLATVVRAKTATSAGARVILPAGRTPLLLYAEVLRRVAAGRLDVSRACFVQLDEYVGLARDDPRSFRSLLRRNLLDPLGRAPRQDLLIDGAASDPRVEIERHAAELATTGGAGSGAERDIRGGADLCFLGLGGNGHVAFNEPGTSSDQRAQLVPLAPETRAAAAGEFGAGESPERGITLGLHEIRAARQIVLLVTGAAKSAILAALLDEPPSSARPASLLLAHPDLVILADRAAAATRTSTPSRPIANPRR